MTHKFHKILSLILSVFILISLFPRSFVSHASEPINLSLLDGAVATASTNVSSSNPDNIRDNDFSSSWTSHKVAGQIEWCQIELASLSAISNAKIMTTLSSNHRTYYSGLSYSVDGVNFIDIEYICTSELVTDENNTSYFVLDYNFPEVLAKYVRMTSTGNVPNARAYISVREFEVWGTEVPIKLSSLSVSEGQMSKEFSPSVYDYVCDIEFEADIPTITAEADNPDLSVEIIQATEETMLATVKVTSVTYNISIYYNIRFNRLPSQKINAKLEELTLSEGELSEPFDPDQLEYLVYLNSNKLPTVTATAQSEYATVEIKQATKKEFYATVTVTSGDGKHVNVYRINFLMNLALNKNTAASSGYSGSVNGEHAVDGRMDTQWMCSNGDTPQWLLVDLGFKAMIYDIVGYQTLTATTRYYNLIYSSFNGKTWELVDTQITSTNITESYGSTMYKMVWTFEPFEARYIKVTGEAATKLRFSEFEVYGIPEAVVSSNAFLKDLRLSNGELTPKFNKYTFNYTVNLKKDQPIPTIMAEAEDEAATLTITQPSTGNMKGTVLVTAENGVTQKTYTVNINRESTPEENANLSSLTSSNGTLLPKFDPIITDYTIVILPTESIPTIYATPATAGATVVINQPTEENMIGSVEVTSLDGSTMKTYTISIFRASANLSSLGASQGTLIPSFHPEIMSYTLSMPAGAELPVIFATLEDSTADMIIVQATEYNPKAIITVTAAGGLISKQYVVNVVYRQTLEDAYLSSLTAVKEYIATNNTTASEIMSLVKNSIKNEDIIVTWTTDFNLIKATSSRKGNITGAITLKLEDENAVLYIDKTIEKLPNGKGSSGGGGGGYRAAVQPVTRTEPNTTTESNISTEPDTPVLQKDIRSEIVGHWGEKEISYLLDAGIVKGDGNSLNLSSNISRAEFITLCVNGLGLELSEYQDIFKDVPREQWYAPYLQTAYNKNIVEGFEGKIRPDDPITREEATKILTLFYGLNKDLDSMEESKTFFKDHENISAWAEEYVQKTFQLGLIQGFDTGDFKPQDLLRREQAMVMVYRLIHLLV